MTSLRFFFLHGPAKMIIPVYYRICACSSFLALPDLVSQEEAILLDTKQQIVVRSN